MTSKYSKYLSILRGINVSGQKKIKMVDLKKLYEDLDLKDVITYIQSGNVIFSYEQKKKINFKPVIEKAIEEKYGFFVPVEIRTNNDILNIIKSCPFGVIDLENDGTKVVLTFLSEKPHASKIKELMQYVKSPEELVVKNKEIYLYCPNGYGKTKLSNAFIERKLDVVATTRNWKSICKLNELVKDF